MQLMLCLVLFGLFCVTTCEEEFLPSYITPCKLEDKELADCVREQIKISLPHFTKGVPEFNVPSIDPVKLDDIKIDGNGLVLTFTQAAMHGLSKSELTDLRVKIGDSDEDFKLAFKGNLSLTAKYEVDGRILILPIQGKGDAFVYAQGVEVEINSKLSHVKDKQNRTHFKLITPSYNYTIERTTFDLKNLFNGNKQLADTTIQFANENWRQLMDDLAPPAIKQIVRTCVKAINKFFSNVTIARMVKGYKDH
ncbi:circadian clock-controlled protein daywake-like [Plodia interpunctella]|uniref:circadian clock-controlled protein daywake-like n=1 Tax=Plodia interpunctella TaxID=58824 RepID=UPI002368ABA0|nr:circadian clock-controlled protein daywake-like [Plodia interpunctella]